MTSPQLTKLIETILMMYADKEISEDSFNELIKKLPYDIHDLNYALSFLDKEYIEIYNDYIYIEAKQSLTIDESNTNLEKGYIMMKKEKSHE